jgi:hypothetical protein
MKKYQILFVCAILISLYSCRAYYVPNENSTPMLSHKNNLILNGGASIGMRANSFAGSIAYAPTNNIGLVYQRSGYNNASSGYNYNSGSFNEFSIGYYKVLEDRVLFELYFNHGFGQTENMYSEALANNRGIYNTKFDKTSLNFAIGTKEENVAFSFYTRIGSLDINDVYFRNINNISLLEDLSDIKSKRYFTFIEPGISGKIGFGNFKFYTKGSFSFIDQNYSALYFQQFQLTFGIQLDLIK